MKTSTSPFKKKPTFDFMNVAMTSSIKVTSGASNTDEKYLAMQKQLRTLKKSNSQLNAKYEKMKAFSISQRVEIEMSLDEAENQIEHLTEQNGMLKSRIQFLEKEANRTVKNYERPLNRSITQSPHTMMRKSITPNEKNLNISVINSDPDRSILTDRSDERGYKTQTSIQENHSILHVDESFFTATESGGREIKFDDKVKQQKPLIFEESDNEVERPYCGNDKCIKNFKELQFLREQVSDLADEMEEVYMKLQFGLDRRNGLKEVMEYKLDLQKASKQTSSSDFYYKGKVEYLSKKLNQKLSQMNTNSPDYCKTIEPKITLLKQRMARIKKEKEDLVNQSLNEPYDYEAEQEQVERIAKTQKRTIDALKEHLTKTGKIDENMEKVFSKYDDWRQKAWKEVGIKE